MTGTERGNLFEQIVGRLLADKFDGGSSAARSPRVSQPSTVEP